MHGLPFAQFQQSAPRAGRHEMEIRDAAVASSSRSRTTSCCPGTRNPTCPRGVPPVGAAPSSSGTRGGVFRAGVGIPAQVSLHPRQFRVTTFPGAACPEPICRRPTPGATTRPVPPQLTNHTRRTPLEARETAAGVGTFTWPKTGTANWPLTPIPNAALGIAVGASLHPAGSGQGACADWYADRDTRNGTGVSSISFRVPPEHSGPRRPGQSATSQGRRRGS